ncbi:hypothetical protein LYZ92_21815, partial [Xanthomonas hortorum pv. taraxaci]
VRMGGNCKKPAFSVANTGSFSTPVQTSRPCGRWVVGVFQGRLNNRKTRVLIGWREPERQQANTAAKRKAIIEPAAISPVKNLSHSIFLAAFWL